MIAATSTQTWLKCLIVAGSMDRPSIHISLENQQLELLKGGLSCASYSISTALMGSGEQLGSGCTPRGRLKIRIKIGHGLPIRSVLVGRRPTGEIYSEALDVLHPDRDWILTRILWLTGAEPGFNRGGERDTLKRYIYIHGTPDSEPMGTPLSHGCIRMRNRDIEELFELVESGTEVTIVDEQHAY